VLLDVGMPRMNGYEAAQRIRALPGGEAIRLIALTGWGQAEDRRRSAEAGFDAHLTKPVAFADLQQLLAAPAGVSPGSRASA
jgi:CheY-like chemotaxis protein